MESKGASSPGILALTTSLSKPFTRLDRYPALLKELERHMEVSLGLLSVRSDRNVAGLMFGFPFCRTSTPIEPTSMPSWRPSNTSP